MLSIENLFRQSPCYLFSSLNIIHNGKKISMKLVQLNLNTIIHIQYTSVKMKQIVKAMNLDDVLVVMTSGFLRYGLIEGSIILY